MPDEPFQMLSHDDQREALQVTAGRSGRPAYLLEKDIWVLWTLRSLVSAPFGEDLTFKGGTSLSKAYHVIRRFSENLDITYDIRAIAPDLIAGNDGNDIPPTRSQEQCWSREIRMRLAQWANEQALLSAPCFWLACCLANHYRRCTGALSYRFNPPPHSSFRWIGDYRWIGD